MTDKNDEGLIYLADTINGIVWATFKLRVIMFVLYIAFIVGLVWWTT